MVDTTLSRMIRKGQLCVTFPDGKTRVYGPGDAPQAGMRIADDRTLRALCINPELALGEGYMDGRIEIEGEAVADLLTLLLRNRDDAALPVPARALNKMRYWLRMRIQRNTPRIARRNVAHHYDLSDDLYALFLDEDWQYSCAYFAEPGMTLEEAQAAKKSHIAQKLMIEPGMRVLDIGCGWGGMALTLARDYGARVTGVTLSENQLARGRTRAETAGLSDRIDLRLQDYRTLTETFDRIVSVGMLEHVGVPQYATYFDKVHDMLAPEGVALIHTIGRIGPPTAPSPWINKYIFPGGYVPSLSELAPALEALGLYHTDLEIWRTHYAKTLREWRERFEAQLTAVRKMYDERFIRMWRYYLTACECAFEEQGQAVFHMQLAHDQRAVPVTRDYLYPAQPNVQRHAAQ